MKRYKLWWYEPSANAPAYIEAEDYKFINSPDANDSTSLILEFYGRDGEKVATFTNFPSGITIELVFSDTPNLTE